MTEPWVIVHRDAPETEREAAALAEQSYPQRALAVLRYLVAVGGDFDNHGCQAMHMIKDSYAPARNALMRKGYVEDSGRRTLNERGRRVIIWQATPIGRTAARTGDLDLPAPPNRRKSQADLEADVLTAWVELLVEALEELDPDHEVLLAWRSR